METYNDLITAKVLLDKARVALFAKEGDSPAWQTLLRVTAYLNREAAAAYEAVRQGVGQ